MPEFAVTKTRDAFRVNLWITFVGFLDTHLLIPIMALYASQLGARIGIVGLIIGAYSIANAPANILFGRVIDRVGAKVPLTLGLIGDALAMFLYSLCRIPVHLVLVRIFHGVTGGIIGPATMSINASNATAQRGGRTMALYGMSLAAATLVGYLLSATLSSRLGYDFVFYVGALMLVSGAIVARLIPKTVGGTLMPSVSLKSQLGKVAELLKRRGVGISYISVFAQYFAFGGVVTLLPVYLRSLGMEAFHVGMMLATFAITFVALQIPSGILSDRIGRKIPLVIGLCLCVVSLAILPTLEAFPTLIGIMVLYGVSYALIFPSISAMVADYTSPEERGRATGVFHALLTVGVAVGAPVMGWVAESIGVKWGLALCGSAAMCTIAVVLISSRFRLTGSPT